MILLFDNEYHATFQEEHWKLESIEIAPVPTIQSVLAEMQKEESIMSEVSEEVTLSRY